jgi:hypothetical protein
MQEAEAMQVELADYQLSLKASFQSWDEVWTDRPAIPMNPVVLQPLEFAGESVSSKLTTLRQLMAEHHADGLFLSVLDEIAWTLNVRGNDVHCNPVALSYLLITPQEATFFVYPQKLTPEVEQALQAEGIRFRSYTEVAASVPRQAPVGGRCAQQLRHCPVAQPRDTDVPRPLARVATEGHQERSRDCRLPSCHGA